MKKVIFLFLLFITLFFWSCKRDVVYDSSFDIAGKWHKDCVKVFCFDITDTTASYNVWLNVEHSTDYPNSNLWLFIEAEAEYGKKFIDTFECYLCDRTGEWHGSGWFATKQLYVPYRMGQGFAHSGEITMHIKHASRFDSISVSKIGLFVEKQVTK